MVELSQSMDMSLKHNITNATLSLNGNSVGHGIGYVFFTKLLVQETFLLTGSIARPNCCRRYGYSRSHVPNPEEASKPAILSFALITPFSVLYASPFA
ncbi:hypothetical protein F443_06645 [Phytophthora nicotianae P1569]|uniref:Uncharacterized protein n=1 Tax=Phytophthora nicotianae P1569 TaxID=1317065 RepID=V9FDE9_PHYNI|nr:hypothetical protein F443_06645 [Phytophthora nicotianae P1569]